ncbi:hypothetical protein [Pseudomonas juntendi]|jgi:hypothetical protein|uniref:hypothetical protein n=1 Tax=Pseudomonas juntendi TaxID=2666183 RepID=UPI003B9614CA
MAIDTWWPVHHAYKGVTLIVDFKWRNGLEVPSDLCINCSWPEPNRHARLGDISNDGKWRTREEAVQIGIRTAETWYDSLLANPDPRV